MKSKAITILFEEEEDITDFINKNNIAKKDIIHTQYYWNLGNYYYTFKFYANPKNKKLKRIIKKKNKIASKAIRRNVNIALAVSIIFFLSLIVAAFLYNTLIRGGT